MINFKLFQARGKRYHTATR